MFGVGAARLRGRPVTPGDHGCSHAITTPMGVTGVNDGTAVRNDATLLLGLDGLVVERVERAADGRRVVYVVTADETAAACPTCGVFAFRVKEYVSTSPRDLPWGRSGLRLVWRKRRWYCTERLCPRGSFTESVPVVPARARMTG